MGMRDVEQLRSALNRRRHEWCDQPMEQLMTGLTVPRLASAVCKAADVRWKERTIGTLNDREIDHICKTACGLRLQVKGVQGFDRAQVARGGADVKEFDPFTL